MTTMENCETVAIMIRQELKETFRHTSFEVKIDDESVNVTWVDGPTYDAVENVTWKYHHVSFNSYDMLNIALDVPRVKYVTMDRTISNDIKMEIFNWLKDTCVIWEDAKDLNSVSDSLTHPLHMTDEICMICSRYDLTYGFSTKLIYI